MRKFYSLLLLMFAFCVTQAQTVTLGSGTSTTSNAPIRYNWGYNYTQTIYTASEITTAGGSPGYISKIRYMPTASVSTEFWKDWVIYIGTTSKDGFTSTTDWIPVSLSEKVFDGAILSNTSANQWMEIELNNLFYWDGTSNVVISVDENTPSYGNNPLWAAYTLAPSSGNKVIYYYNDGTNPNPLSPPTASGRSNIVAQLQLEFASACSGVPEAGTLSFPSNSVCQGSSIAINHTGSTNASGLNYQIIYSSDANGPWTNFGSSATSKFSTLTPASTGYYRIVVSCGGLSDTTNAQLLIVNGTLASNTYSVGGSGADFATLTDAINAAKCGVTGAVTFKMNTGTYTEQITIPQINGLNSSTRLIIDGSGSTLKFNGTSARTYTMGLDGADYITVKNLTIEGTNPDTGRVVHLWNDANYNIFDSVTIKASLTATTSNSVGFCLNNSLSSATTGGPGGHNKLTNSTVIGGYYGVNLYGASGTGVQTDNEVSNTLVQNFYYYGIFATYNTNPVISKNIVERPTRSDVSAFYAIYLSSGCINGLVESNKIRNSFGGNTTSTSSAFCIYVSSTSASAGNENKVFNNAIYNMNGEGTEGGLYFSSGTHIKAYHNTIVFDNTASNSSSTSYGIYSTANTNVDIKNNMVSITKGGTGTKYAIYFSSASAGTRTSNYNVLHMGSTAGAANNVGYYGSAKKTLSDWQSATSQDANSLDADPMIVGYMPTSSAVDDKGTPIAGITTDIDGNARSATTPDIGALEFTISNCSGMPSAGNSTTVDSTCSSVPLTLSNSGATIGDGITYEWESSPKGQNTWTAISGANSANFTLTGGITEASDFRLKVTCTYSSMSAYSDTLTVDIKNYQDCYCIPAYSTGCSSNDRIESFKLNTISNASGTTCNTNPKAFSDYTSMSTDLAQGLNYDATIKIGSGGAAGIAIWIDFNNDGIFDDTEKWNTTATILASGTGTVTISIPSTAPLGQHRMRVRHVFNNDGPTITPCGSYNYGEVEDYTVNIVVPPSCNKPTDIVFSNIGANSVDIGWATPVIGNAPSSYDIHISQVKVNPDTVTVISDPGKTGNNYLKTGLTEQTKYYVWLRSFCGGTDYSAWTVIDSFKTDCNAVNAFSENFDGVTTPQLPNCWSSILRGSTLSDFATVKTINSTPNSYSNPNAVEMYNSSSTATDDIILVSAPVSNLGAGTHRLRFYAKNSSAANDIEVGTISGTGPAAVFTLIETVDINTTFSEYTVDFSLATGTMDNHIAIRRQNASTYTYVYLDNIIWEAIPTCDVPTDIVFSAKTPYSIQIDWSAPTTGSPLSYDLYYNQSGTAPTASTTPSQTNIPGTSTSVASLNPNSKYYVWLRTFCGGTDYSVWTAIDSFTTACEATNVPYLMDFENAVVPNMPPCTSTENAGTGNNWITASSPGSGFTTKVLRYSYNSANPANAWFYTQGLNLTAGVSYRLKFDYGNNSSTYSENLKVMAGSAPDHTSMTDLIIDLPGIKISGKKDTIIDVIAPMTGVFYLGFNAYSAKDQNALFVDNISVTLTPTCDAPTSVIASNPTTNSVQLDWTMPTSGNTPQSYEVYYDKSSTAPTSSTTPKQTGIFTTYTNLTGLDASSTYFVWVRSNCGGGDVSAWSQVASFETGCDVIASFPYVEDFNGTSLPACYTNETVSGTAQWKTVTANGSGNITPKSGNRMAEFRTTTTGNKTKLVLPVFNLTSLNTPEISFWLANENWVGDIDELRLYYKANPGDSWTQFGPSFTTEHATWTEVRLTLPSPSAQYQIALEGTSNWARGVNIDSLTIAESSTLPVSISSFKAENAGSVNNLFWTTGSEINNKGFELEKSADGKKFEKFAFVNSKAEGGNSSVNLHYTHSDAQPFAKGTYYRIRQVDMDGKVAYSDVVFVKTSAPVRMEIVNLYPNPAKNKITLAMSAPNTGNIHIVVSDVSGRVVYSENKTVVAGDNKFEMHVDHLNAGTYMLKVICADGCESAVKKFIKK